MTFGNGRGVTRKADGTILPIGKNVNRVYILETINEPPHMPLALSSLYP